MFLRKAIENPIHVAQTITSDLYLSQIYDNIYRKFYSLTVSKSNSSPLILEIGGGALNYAELYWKNPVVTDADNFESTNNVITGVRAEQLPFEANSFDYVIAKDSLHHFKDPVKALLEINRVLKSGGSLLMSEPYWSPLGRFVYRYIHPEPWDTNVKELTRTSEDLWDSNQALLLLFNTKFSNQFEKIFPSFKIKIYEPTYAISYLISGGVYKRTAISSRFLILINNLEVKSKTFMKLFGLNIIAEFKKTL
jgi:SAM-dependent methyltransferase